VRARLRGRVPRLDHDRYLAPDIAAAADLVRSGALAEAAGVEPTSLEPTSPEPRSA
jgi:histidine ammonia-lyase